MSTESHTFERRAFLGGAATFGAVCLVNPQLAFAVPSVAEKQAEAEAVRSQLITKQNELNLASNDYYTVLEQHDQAVADKDAAGVRIGEIGERIASIQGKLGTRVRGMYRSGSISFIEVLFAARTFEEFANTWNLLNEMNEEDAALVKESKDLRTQAEEEKAEYARQEGIAAKKTAEAKAIKDKAETIVAEMQAALDSLDEEARQLLEQERAAAAEAEASRQRTNLEQTSGGGYTPGGSSIPTNGSVVDYAVSRLGCPYVWAAAGPDSFDCSGLTSWCYNRVGKWITRTSETQKANAQAILHVSEAAPGDVLYRYGHVAIAVAHGGTSYIHAPEPGDVVSYGSRTSGYSAALRF